MILPSLPPDRSFIRYRLDAPGAGRSLWGRCFQLLRWDFVSLLCRAAPETLCRLVPVVYYPGRVKTFEELFAELTEKAATRPAGSSTVAELDAGVHAIGKKVVEEAAEVWMAAEYESDVELAGEIAQAIYHLQVMMIARGISLDDVYREL